MQMNKKNLWIISILIFLNFSLSAQIKILSPLKGKWANPQMLLLENFNDGEVFYSVDGSDPSAFGLAYDSPVLIDAEGEITLKIVHVFKDGRKEDYEVQYEVDSEPAQDSSYSEFIKSFYDTGVINYSAGTEFVIPSNLKFSFEENFSSDSIQNFLSGTSISLSSSSVQSRNIPCTLTDEHTGKFWRFIIRTFPQSAGVYSRREVPLKITDWEFISFTDSSLIYRIDSEYWYMPDEGRKLDRTKSHIIYWQSVDFQEGNPVEFFVLPPKPDIVKNKNDDGSISFSLQGDSSYMLSLISENSVPELFSKISLDTFLGDKIEGRVQIGVYSNSVYQGKIESDYVIDKRLPASPVIKSSAKSFYSRSPAKIEVSCPEDCELYVSLSTPFSVQNTDEVYTASSSVFENVQMSGFKKSSKNSFSVTWNPRNAGAVYYKITAYSKRADNVSAVSEYSLIVDQTSYYYDGSSNSETAEGTKENPFTSFDQCYESLTNVRSVSLHIKGKMDIEKKYPLKANYEFIGEDDAVISFAPGASFILKGSSVELSDCHIQNENQTDFSEVPVFQLENAVLTFNRCTCGLNFSMNGCVIDSFNSIVNVFSSVISVNAKSYCSFLSAVKTRSDIRDTSLSVSAETSVAISATEGNISCSENTFLITGNSGRIMELFGIKATLSKNIFKMSINSGVNVNPIYKNDSTVLTESENQKIAF